jgi:Leucine-rich repeat (LRR) protein
MKSSTKFFHSPVNNAEFFQQPPAPPAPTVDPSVFVWTPFKISPFVAPVARNLNSVTPEPRDPSGCGTDMSPCICLGNSNAAELPTLDCSAATTEDELVSAFKFGRARKFARIVLQGSGLRTLPRSAFGGNSADEYWISSNPFLSDIQKGAFGPQANPSKIICQDNDLRSFPFADLSKMKNLQYFAANGNQLREIPPRAFSIMGGQLVDILLHDNKIKKIGTDAFNNLANLNAVTLHNNLLEEIKDRALFFSKSPSVVTLNNNAIGTVDLSGFCKWKKK